MRFKFPLFLSLLFGLGLLQSCTSGDEVDFSTEIKPILNKRCIACHGGVKKQGGVSFLFEEEAKSKGKSGKMTIVEGDAHASEMIRRLTLNDPEERMPFEADPLPEEEIELLTQWIEQGAKWGEHWAYQEVEKPEIPDQGQDWSKNEIDHFVVAKAEEKGLEVSKEAEPEVLARRVALDLIGFPAPDSLKAAYLANPTGENYEAYVDQLLASPHYGEKWTSMWLDLARYADTKGYERDDERNIWRYRDWLIKAFNADMPYDQFITEQLAGDLLENPTDDQLIATAFHRNTMTNDEGGTDNEEFRIAAVIDRVNTTWETLMSTTFACVQCHSHPYDPFRHEDYYRFMAFFNNTRDNDAYAEYPVLRHLNLEQKEQLGQLTSWAADHLKEDQASEIKHFIKTFQPAINSLETDEFVNSELSDTKWLAMRNNSSARLSNVDLTNDKKLIFRYASGLRSGSLFLHTASPKGPAIGQFRLNPNKGGWQIAEIPLQSVDGKHDIYFTFSSSELKNTLQTGIRFDWFHFTDAPYENLPKPQQNTFWSLVKTNTEETPIMLDNVEEWSRETHVFERGSWLSKGEKVVAGVPVSLNEFSEEYPQNRLGLAQWMTDKKHPLTSRTMVNRVWEQFFGRGLVETLEDLGTQGAEPTHQQLLDYLSYQFMHEDGWQMKKLIKKIVLSATYRQDSRISKKQLEKDQFNMYLARGPRVRLSAEQIRDQALAISGKLNPEMYGKPVMPYQPDGVWLSPYNGKKWKESDGDQQYRRALYTFWKRTSPYPSMINFDGVGREVCSARRINTNTPLQALTTLNDSVYVDLALHFAQQIELKDIDQSIAKAYHQATGKAIDPKRKEALRKLYDEALKSYQKEEEAEILAFAMVTNALFNIDEVIMKN
ncbi:DUF1553 domain-containing protein [Jiulongibacter sediminis]|jgi:hypothetical protein|uniref:DUF1553 domain-containing protein n=1 Tax=Jiulongibacter sediminis TaxID=1605367 RepID=UPI0026F2FB26|nr:DUF1553 domain-containing protein [Jiulongibacter sediminis]